MTAELDLDRDLLRRYKNLDIEAFNLLYQRHHEKIFHFILFKVKTHESAEEVFQETFFRIHKYILSYDDTQPALAWIFSIARHAIYDHFKKFKKKVHESLTEHESTELTTEENLIVKNTLTTLLHEMSDQEARLLIEKYILEKDYFELSEAYQESSTSLRKKISRLLTRLRGKGS